MRIPDCTRTFVASSYISRVYGGDDGRVSPEDPFFAVNVIFTGRFSVVSIVDT